MGLRESKGLWIGCESEVVVVVVVVVLMMMMMKLCVDANNYSQNVFLARILLAR